MRKIIVSELTTVDGVVDSPERWRFNYQDSQLLQYSVEELHAFDALLMGRVTYESFAAFWPSQKHNEFGIADKLNTAPKFVASNSLKTATWNNSRIVSGDVVDGLRKLKSQPGGDIGVTGSVGLVQSLATSGLIDEYRLVTFPIVFGGGRRLFKDGASLPLTLIEAKSFPSGAVLSRYRPAPAQSAR
ncbi:MAG TPA: dihydrofolate reductase family protein [Thermoplasmata archaeon]|nr:dihydrofolate reductase family protein [Thermoplasmata archaeon]